MSENMKNISNIAEVQNTPETQSQRFTLDYCLEQIEQIRRQTASLHDVVGELGKVMSTGADDVFSREKVAAISDVAKCRETTNQQLIAFYEKMYDDLKPAKADLLKKELLAMLIDILENPDVLEQEEAVQSIAHLIENAMMGIGL